MRTMRLTGYYGLGYLAASLPLLQTAAAAPPPALYTPAQATAGATVFAQNCASCHGANLQGEMGPALTSQTFGPDNGNTVGGIFSLITQQMPLSAPASLTPVQYEDVMSYILSKNGFPSGNTALNGKASLTSAVPLVSVVK